MSADRDPPVPEAPLTSTPGDTEPLLQFFEFGHLPEYLREISSDFWHLAYKLVREQSRNSERTMALRKLLEAKDCAVRARLFKP